MRSRTEDFLTGPSRVNCRFRASVVPQLRLFNPPARPVVRSLRSIPEKGAGPSAFRPGYPHAIPPTTVQTTPYTHTLSSFEFIKTHLRLDAKNGKLGNWSVFSRNLAYISMCPPAGLAMGLGRAGRKATQRTRSGPCWRRAGRGRHAAASAPPAGEPRARPPQHAALPGHDGGATSAGATHTARRGSADEQQPVADVDRNAAPRPLGRGEHDDAHGNRVKIAKV